MSVPNFYFWGSLFTWGEADLRDYNIVYMDNVEAFVYFWLNSIDIMLSWPMAVVHTTLFGIVYLMEMVWWCFKMMFMGKDGKGKKKWMMNKMDGDKSKDNDDDDKKTE